MNNGERNEQIRRAVEDIMSSAPKKETDVDRALRMGTEINKRVQARLQETIAGWVTHPLTKPPKEEMFDLIQRAFLDDLAQNRLSRDELTFLFSFNCAKILTDHLWTNI